MTFQLCLLASEPGPNIARLTVRGTRETLAVMFPPVVASPDITHVQPLTRAFWQRLVRGAHSLSEAILTLKPEAAARVQTEASKPMGGGFAILINGEVAGQLIIAHPLQGRDLPIGGTFSDREAQTLAEEINSNTADLESDTLALP